MATETIRNLKPGQRCLIGGNEVYLRKINYDRNGYDDDYYFCHHDPFVEPLNKSHCFIITVIRGTDFKVELL